MQLDKKPDYKSLENNIIEIIKEEQIKLGFRKETIRLYYPMESIMNLLHVDLALNELENILNDFCEYVNDRLGKIEISHKEQRFCITIPPTGVTYVHEEVEDRVFLTEFIQKISEHHCTINDILAIFQRHSKHVKCEKISNGEFDYLIYFEDEIPDAYRYCIKFEECHTIYHRFTLADYESFQF